MGIVRSDRSGAPDTVRLWLRLEGAAVFVAALWLYRRFGGGWLVAIPLLLAPDLSMIGYLRGSGIGSVVYNLFHNWVIGLAVVAAGVWSGSSLLMLTGAILVAHVGMDRLFGYGLKHPSGFKDTHLQRA
jgi:uncharacterized protein DUF4260